MKGEAAALLVRAQRCQSHYFSATPSMHSDVIVAAEILCGRIRGLNGIGRGGIRAGGFS